MKLRDRNEKLQTNLFIPLSDTPNEKQTTIHLDHSRREGALHHAGDRVDDFESSSSLDDSHGTSDDVVGRDHPIVDVQELTWDYGGDQGVSCLLEEFLNEFTNVFNES